MLLTHSTRIGRQFGPLSPPTITQRRLREVAGFKEVPEPIPMRNRKNAIVYYLFLASQKKTGAKIARDIMKKYANYVGS